MPVSSTSIEQLSINTIRTLSMDAVQAVADGNADMALRSIRPWAVQSEDWLLTRSPGRLPTKNRRLLVKATSDGCMFTAGTWRA